MVATELLKLAMETEEERKERLKKMVANHSAEEELGWEGHNMYTPTSLGHTHFC